MDVNGSLIDGTTMSLLLYLRRSCSRLRLLRTKGTPWLPELRRLKAGFEVKEVSTRLAERETQLERMTNSLGWRLLSYYGPIKYRFVLPAYKSIKKAFKVRTAKPEYFE